MDQNNSSDLIKERCYFEDENLKLKNKSHLNIL